jgi:hypothetical protein
MKEVEIREQYDLYCKRMREKGAEFAIIPFKIFKESMERFEEKGAKNV